MRTATDPDSYLRVALAQIDIELGQARANLDKAASFISQAAQQGADIILLPELWTTGYDLERSHIHAQAMRAAILPELACLASQHRIYIIGSLLIDDDEGYVFNSAIMFDSTGKAAGTYSKVHLFGLMEEDRFLAAGNAAPVFVLPSCKVGVAICYDLRFPELFRKYALDGVSIVLLPAEWPTSRIEHWRTLIRARAIENQYFVAACNRVGVSKEIAFGGNSMVVDPYGNIVVEGDETEKLLVASIDLQCVRESRTSITSLDDRRPDVYGCVQQWLPTEPLRLILEDADD
jgi:omega-amidase